MSSNFNNIPVNNVTNKFSNNTNNLNQSNESNPFLKLIEENENYSKKRFTIQSVNEIFNKVDDQHNNNNNIFNTNKGLASNTNTSKPTTNNFNNIVTNSNIPPKLPTKNFESDEKETSVPYHNNIIAKNNRMTLNLKDEIEKHMMNNENNLIGGEPNSHSNSNSNGEEELAGNNNKNYKRYTISLQETLDQMFNNNNNNNNNVNDDLDNSFEMRLENSKRESNISLSPINVKNHKIYYETCLSSASRNIERTEAKCAVNLNPKEKENIIASAEIVENKEEQETPKFEKNSADETFDKRITINNIHQRLPPQRVDMSPVHVIPINNNLRTIGNNNMNMNIISPKINNNLIFSREISNSNSNDNCSEIDKRIHDLMSKLSETLTLRAKTSLDIEKEISKINTKLKELQEENNKLNTKKQQLKEAIKQFDKECLSLTEKKLIVNFPLTLLGIRILSSNFNLLRLQLLKKINLTFSFRDFNWKIIQNQISLQQNSNYTPILEKISFDLLKSNNSLSERLIDDKSHYKLLKIIYEDLISGVIKPFEYGNLTPVILQEKLKLILKQSGSFLYLLDLINCILTIGLDVNLKYEKESQSVLVIFTLLNRLGFKVTFLFGIEVKNSFFGISFKEIDVVNISLSMTNFGKCCNKVKVFKEEIEKFFSNSMREKIKNPVFFKEFLYKLQSNILNL
jgi:hypothetical protein